MEQYLKLKKKIMINCKLKRHVGISFGGLLLGLEGKNIHLNKILNDEKVFCLMKINN